MEEEIMMKKKKRKKEESSGMLSKLVDIEGEEEEDEEVMMVHMGGVFSKLPSDIFYDILSRVPIKSLSQCKWVCKTWFKIIYKPRFAELQYAKQIQTTRCSSFVVVANDFIEFYLLDSQVFDDFGTSTTAYSFKMKGMDEAYNRNSLKRVYQVVGSVNGLICFSDDPYKYGQAPYYICNPITGDHITLSLSPKYDIKHVTSAFGFSPITNEYKVVRILKPEFHKFKNGDKNIETEAEIFTLGSDNWRRIQSFPYPSGSDHNLLLNGNLYWTTFKNMEPVILSFNVATEEFDIIQPPPCVKQNGNIFKDLRVLGENLCFIISDYYDFQIEVWVMKKYGVATSWAKEYVFKKKSQSNGVNLFWYKNYEVMKLWNGELLLRRGQETLGYYDPNEGTFKRITVHEMPDLDYVIRPPIMLSGSLFSPKNVHKLRMRRKRKRVPGILHIREGN